MPSLANLFVDNGVYARI